MRSKARLTLLIAFAALAVPACASSPDDKPIDQQSIAALEARITQAQPREQCFLYAELIHQMTEYSLKQYAAGDVEKANDLLRQIQQVTHKMHLSVAEKDKRLKNAEILLRHTALRLSELLHSSTSDEQPVVQETLAQVSQAQNEAMLTVFRK
ncbi:MAG TPA: hypothetical protein VKB47_15640 [Terracidiphilus sp.]|jgi:hypothetical protein|nr:hypothetical protein [Terracidiphilus sp.]